MRSLSLIILFAAPAAWSQPASAPSRVVTLDEAVATMHAHQPQLRQARAQVDVAMARADEAHASLMPQVNGNASYSGVYRNGTSFGLTTTSGGSALNSGFNDQYSASVGASWLIWDFGQARSRWHSAQASAEAQRADEAATDLTILLQVRTAFFSALAGKALVQVANATLVNQQQHLEQIQNFVTVGTRPEIDLAQARTNVANARVALINAQNGYDTARAQLNQAMGIEGPIDYDVADTQIPAIGGEDDGAEPLVDQAFKTRPELQAFIQAIRAQELSLEAAEHNWLPSFSIGSTVTDAGSVKAGNNSFSLNAGVSLSWPIWLGGEQEAQRREQRANLMLVQSQEDALRQSVRLAVVQAQLAVRAAKAGLDASNEALTNANEQLRLAEGRYQAGVGNIIELSDAQVAQANAAAQQVQAVYRLATARAQLLQSLGE